MFLKKRAPTEIFFSILLKRVFKEKEMAYEMRASQGSAFKNRDRKEDWHADFRGKVMLPDGSVHYMDVWIKKTKNGDDWVSVKVGKQTVADQPRQDGHSEAKSNGYQPQNVADMKDDIPF